jgi:hypothetical protein
VRKVFAALAFTVLAAGALAGCDIHLGPYAAIVDGTTISQQELNASVSAAASSAGYLCTLNDDHQLALPVTGVGTGAYDVKFVDDILSTLVEAKLATDEMAREHLAVTSFVEPIANQQLDGTLGTSVQGCSGTPASILAALPTAYRSALLDIFEDLDVLGGARLGITLTNDGVTQYVDAHPADTELPCVNYIQASSLAAANEAIAAVKKGTPFTTEAPKVTVAQSTTIPCGPLDQTFPPQIVAAISPLPVGGMTAPIDYENNIYVFELGQPQAATTQQVLGIVVETLQSEFQAAATTIVASGNVQLDPAYGVWSTVGSNQGISPPPSPPSKFVPAPASIAVPTPTTVPAAASAG